MGFWKSVSDTCSKVGTTGVFAGLATICTGLAISSFTRNEESSASENKEVNDAAPIDETVEAAKAEQQK
jgi:hypothetical protein